MKQVALICTLVLMLGEPALAQTLGNNASITNSVPISLTDGATITVPCPGPATPITYYLTLTGNNHQVLFPSCPTSSNGLSVKFRINAGSAPFTGLTFATSGFSWTGGTPYAICTAAATPNPACPAAESVSQVDWFGCDVVGTTSPSTEWNCWTPQYNVAPSLSFIAQAACIGNASAGCTTSAINTTGANLFIVSISSDSLTPGATDSSSNAYTVVKANGTAFSSPVCVIYDKVNPTTSASQTFTTAATNSSLGILAYRIAAPAADQTNGSNSNTTAVSTIQPGSITPTVPNEILVALGAIGGANSLTVGSGFTASSQNVTGVTGNNHYGTLSAFLTGTPGAINPTFTGSGSSTACAVIASFQ